MRSSTFLVLTGAVVAAYAGARWLMGPEAQLERLPAPVRGPAAGARGRLLRARAHVNDALREGAAERDTAMRDLMREYHHRSGRS